MNELVKGVIEYLLLEIEAEIVALFDKISSSLVDGLLAPGNFKKYFAFFISQDYKEFIGGIGTLIAIILICYELFMILTSPNSKASFYDTFKNALFAFVMLGICYTFYGNVWDFVQPILTQASLLSASSTGNITEINSFNAFVIATKTVLGNSIFCIMLTIIMVVIIMIEYFKFILEIFERYLVTNVLLCISPIASGFLASSNFAQVFVKYIMMLLSSFLVLIYNVLFLKAFSGAMGYFVIAWNNNSIVPDALGIDPQVASLFTWFFMVLGFLKVGQKIDAYFDRMGLTTAQTGGAIARTLAGVAISSMGVARSISSSSRGRERAASGKLQASGLSQAFQGQSGRSATRNIDRNPELMKMASNTRGAINSTANPYHVNNRDLSAMDSGSMKFAMDNMTQANPMVGEKVRNTIAANFDQYKDSTFKPNSESLGGGMMSAEVMNADGTSFGLSISDTPFEGATELKDNDNNLFYAKETPIDGPIGGFTPTESPDFSMNERFSPNTIDQLGFPADSKLNYVGDGVYNVYDNAGTCVGTVSSNDYSDFNSDGALATDVRDNNNNSYSVIHSGSDFDALMGRSDFSASQYSEYADAYGVNYSKYTNGAIPSDSTSVQNLGNSYANNVTRDTFRNSDFEAKTGISLENPNTRIDASNYANLGQIYISQSDTFGNKKSVTVALASEFQGQDTFKTNNGTTFAYSKNNTVEDKSGKRTAQKRTVEQALPKKSLFKKKTRRK